MKLRNFLNTCENIDILHIYKIRPGVDTEIAFDPIDDTDLVFYQDTFDMRDIPAEYLDEEVQLWSITSIFGINVYI